MALAQAEDGNVHELDPMCAAAAAAATLVRAYGLSPPLAQLRALARADVLLTSVRLPSQIGGAELLREYNRNCITETGAWGAYQ